MSNNQKYCEPSIARVYSEHVRATTPISRPPPFSLETRCISTHLSKNYDDSDPVLSGELDTHMRKHYPVDDIEKSVQVYRFFFIIVDR